MTFLNYDLEKMVEENHLLKRIEEIVPFKSLLYRIKDAETTLGRKGYGLEVGLRCVFLQFKYDLSDRQLEERLRYDIALKWFCGFEIDEKTPDHTFFSRVRKAIGTKRIGKIFSVINKKTANAGILKDVFTFIDATSIITKETTWAERDKAIKDGEDKLNNDNIDKYSSDKDARFGCKGKNKFWYGYKKHASVDMGSGLIKKVAVTKANVSDGQGVKNVCPKGGMIFADKAYCVSVAQTAMKTNGCHSGAILKNNMLGKNKDKDRWISQVRAPFESTFAKDEKRARYKGLAKVQMQAFLEAIVFNLTRLVKINAPPILAGA